MIDEMRCERVRELAPDVAVGIADGQERDAALRHTASCAECRRLIADLSSVVDELLLLAPEHEPPPGFAARTVDRMSELSRPGVDRIAELSPAADRIVEPSRTALVRSLRRARARRPARPWVRRVAVATAFALAVAIGAGSVFTLTSSDRRLAHSYRSVLALGRGSFFTASALRGPSGPVGTVWGYQGAPSWLFATAELPVHAPTTFRVSVDTEQGRTIALGTATLGPGRTSWGSAIPVALTDVTALRFVSRDGTLFVAYIAAVDPWATG
jgi:hypothetical protein